MIDLSRQAHWEKIYHTKQPSEVSWFQPKPEISLQIIESFNLPKSAKLIDVGGGDSLLVDNLLELGFTDISVLDISKAALDKARKRLGAKAEKVKWIVADVTVFRHNGKYDLWHDRAAFHFLINKNEISRYVKAVNKYLHPNGFLILGTFSEQGPNKCSGLDIKQYSEHSMSTLLKDSFEKINCFTTDHRTPSGSFQNFLFCAYRKK